MLLMRLLEFVAILVYPRSAMINMTAFTQINTTAALCYNFNHESISIFAQVATKHEITWN